MTNIDELILEKTINTEVDEIDEKFIMDIKNIEKPETFLGREDYFGMDWDETLKLSHKFSDYVSKIALAVNLGISCKIRADENAFIDYNGNKKRYCDTELIYKNERNSLEMKDFCRFVKYPATGLPINYIDKISNTSGFNQKNIFLFFIDNPAYIKKRASIYKMKQREVLNELISDGFAEIIIVNGKKEISFIPYGNRLDILMQKNNRRLDMENKDVFYSKFGVDGRRLPQIIWKVEKGIMLPVKEALRKNLIGNK